MKLLIIDDEAPARKELARLLAQVAPNARHTEAEGVETARKALTQERFDGVLLDLEMPDAGGFDFFSDANLAQVPVIITTAHERHAIECIDRGVIGYLLKPIEPDKLARALLRLQAGKPPPGSDRDLILLSDLNHHWPLRADEIVMVVADDGYSHVTTRDGRQITLSRTLKEIEALLHGHGFIRANRGEIINLTHASVIRRQNGGDLVADMGKAGHVSFSRRQGKALRAGELL